MFHQLVSPKQYTQLTRPNTFLFQLMTSLSLLSRMSKNWTLAKLKMLQLVSQLPNPNLSFPHTSVSAG